MGANQRQLAINVSTHETGRFLTVKDNFPDWFETPPTREAFIIHKNTKLVLVEGRLIQTTIMFNYGPKSVTYETKMGNVEHVVLIPAGTSVRVLPDFSFFMSNVIIKRAGIKRGILGQVTFYPPKPKGLVSHLHERPRPPYSVAIRTYAGSQ